jgi:xanthine dehydrogenase accessory factor
MRPFTRLIEAIAAEGAGALVSLIKVEGSTPREAGARMVVRPSGGFHGTIGGGELEWQALAASRQALAEGRGPARRAVKSLGPDLAQCCGGRVEWLIETFDASDKPDLTELAAAERAGAFGVSVQTQSDGRLKRKVEATGREGAPFAMAADGVMHEYYCANNSIIYLFGAGHVGRALVLALAPLPFDVRWIDSREDAFPERAPPNVTMMRSVSPAGELAAAPDGAQVLVMTHSHPLDLDIVARALREGRFSFVGLIGSATKRARFMSQMRAAGLNETALAAMICPIGLPGLEGKEPAVIAASAAAQLLMARSRVAGHETAKTHVAISE